VSETRPELWRETAALFHEVVELDLDRRAARLSEIGRTAPALRAAVESLLAADAVAAERLARFDFGVSALRRQSTSPGDAEPRDPLALAGRTVSHFRVLGYLASGGMGVVYRAEDTRLKRAVALKFPLPNEEPDSAVKERFAREARAVGALDHGNLCTVYEIGESEHGLFLAMPLYSGETLNTRLAREGPLAVGEVLAIAKQLAAGLACAHAAGVIHRDLKPGNVMLLPDGTVKILDFGLAKLADASQTKSGSTPGTISYMAPEQIRGGAVDARTDIWSVGVMLYEMLSGARPFRGDHQLSIIHAVLHDEPRPLAVMRNGIPRPVQTLVRALLSKDVASRYPSARALTEDIDAIQQGASPAFAPRVRVRAAAWTRRHRTQLGLLLAVMVTAAVALLAPPLSSALDKPTRNADAYQFYLLGRDYERRGPYAAAESLYSRAIALDPGFALARARLAVVHAACRAGGSRDCYRRGIEDRPADRLEQIRTGAMAALQLQPRLADAHLAMGLYWEQREDPERALAEYELARDDMRNSGELHAAMGRAHRAMGHWKEAIGELERAIVLDSRDATSIADLATTYSRLRRYEESVRNWDRYLALVPDAYQGRMIRGQVYLRWHGTIDTLTATLARLPAEWQKRSFATRVFVARIEDRPLDALAALDEAPAPVPDDPVSYHSPPLLRAQVYTDLRDSARARAHFDSARVTLERSVALKPDDFRRQLALGLAYAGLGRATEAKRAADRAMEIMPPSRTVPAGTLALRGAAEILAQLPEHRHAAIEILDRLMRMPAGREASVPLLRVDPAWKPLRADPRFQQLLAKYAAQ